MHWLEEYGSRFGNWISEGKISSKRVAHKTGLSLENAQLLGIYARSLARGYSVACSLGIALREEPEEEEPEGEELSEGGEEKDTTPAAPIPPEEEEDKPSYLFTEDYVYQADTDTYVTFVKGIHKPVALPGDTHRAIVRAYSNWDDTPASLNELAREFGLPRQLLSKYLRIHAITHDREPFTNEEMLEKESDSLVEDLLQMRRQTFYRKASHAKWAEIHKDAQKWRTFSDTVLVRLEQHLSSPPRSVPIIHVDRADRPYAAVMGLTDFHWGLRADTGLGAEPWDRKVARERLLTATEEVLGSASRLGRPDKIYVPVGSDFLHVDNDQATTTGGTSQDVDGSPAELLASACDLLEDWIDIMRGVAPVELVFIEGNHDRLLGLGLLLVMEALYRRVPDVICSKDRRARQYRQYGRNLLGFAHGDGRRAGKPNDLAGHMAREASEMWSDCDHKTYYSGHHHHEVTLAGSTSGVVVRQMPSLSGASRWAAREGYQGSPRPLPLYVHDRDRGLIAVLYSNEDCEGSDERNSPA